MTAEQLAQFAGVFLSLAFSYIPGLSGAYEQLEGIYKRLVMAGLLAVVAGAAFGLSCYGIIDAVVCTQEGALGLVRVFVAALIANQGTYLLAGTRGK